MAHAHDTTRNHKWEEKESTKEDSWESVRGATGHNNDVFWSQSMISLAVPDSVKQSKWCWIIGNICSDVLLYFLFHFIDCLIIIVAFLYLVKQMIIEFNFPDIVNFQICQLCWFSLSIDFDRRICLCIHSVLGSQGFSFWTKLTPNLIARRLQMGQNDCRQFNIFKTGYDSWNLYTLSTKTLIDWIGDKIY